MLKESDLNLKGVNLYRDFPVITAKTNSGKTTFAVMDLRRTVEKRTGKKLENVILLTPYTRTKNQILSDERFSGLVADVTEMGNAIQEQERVYVCTYAKVCALLERNEIDLSNCLVVFDELHRWLQFTVFQHQMSYLIQWLIVPEKWQSFIALGMTATPYVLDFCENLPFRFADITPNQDETILVKRAEVIDCGSSESVAKRLVVDDCAKGVLFYVQSATQAYKLKRFFEDKGFTAAFICSESNENLEPTSKKSYAALMQEQNFEGKSILSWIDSESDLPQSLDVLIINSAAIDGINILDRGRNFSRVVVESTSIADVEQVRARLRHNIERLTVVFSLKYQERICSSEDDVKAFHEYLEYLDSEQRDKIGALQARYTEQIEAAYAAKCSESARNSAIRNGEKRPTKETPLDIVVCKCGKNYFTNPFALGVAAFESECISKGAFDMVCKLTDLLLDSSDMPEYIIGSEYIQETNFKMYESQQDFISIFGLVGNCEKIFTCQEFKEKCKEIELKRADYKKAGVSTIVAMLKRHLRVEQCRMYIDGKRKRVYKIACPEG